MAEERGRLTKRKRVSCRESQEIKRRKVDPEGVSSSEKPEDVKLQSETDSSISQTTRNIVLIGKTGAGKSTVANHMIDFRKALFEVDSSISSVTRSIRRNQEPVTCEVNGVKCNIKLVDTVGLHDTQLQNPDIIAELKQSFPEGINLILFVCQYCRITEEDREPFNFLVSNLQEQASDISALIVTGCEGIDESARSAIVSDFRTSNETVPIATFMKKGILCVGFPDLTKVKPSLKELYKEDIVNDEDTLRALVHECGKGQQMFEEEIPFEQTDTQHAVASCNPCNVL